MRVISTVVLIFLLLETALSFGQSPPVNDFETIRNQIFTNFQGTTSPASLDALVAGHISLINSNGSFSDITYSDNSQTIWKPGDHLTRMSVIAKAYSNTASTYYNNPTVLAHITSLMNYWLSLNPAPSSTNWYFYAISVPKDIGNTLICLRKSPIGISLTLENSMIQWMTKGVPITTAPSNEGSNLIDVASHYIMRASLLEDATLMTQTVNRITTTISVTTGEGIQADHSFRAHGAQLYTYGYGSVFVSGITSIAQYLYGTTFEIPPAKIAIISDFMRKGFIAASRGRYTDFNVYNRGISRTNAGKAESGLVQRFSMVDLPSYSTYYAQVIDRMKGITTPSVNVEATNTHYWRSDYTVHHRAPYMLGLRSVSNRTVKAENGNGESLKSYYMTDGVTYVAVNGNEYDGIYPVWNWSKLPGTTVPELSTIPVRTAWGANPGKTAFVGAVSDGLYGAHTYAMNDYNTTAKKSWFMFDNEIVCLGAGITSTAAEPINTTINQSLLDGDITIKTTTGIQTLTTSSTEHFTDNIQWIYHDSIAYFFPMQGQISVQSQAQSGTMKSINSSLSDNMITKNVFSAWFPHGTNPSQKSYAYTLVPGLSDLNTVTTYDPSAIEILENSADIQAVKHRDLQMIQVVFHKRGTFTSNGISVAVDKPSVLIIKNISTNQVTVHAADPTQTKRQLTIGYSSALIQPMRQVRLTLPIESSAGSTVSGQINNSSIHYIEPIAEVETVEIPVIADAFVRDGSYATTNYGTVNTMPVKNDGTGYNRQIYLKFDPSNYDRPVSKAKLRMYVNSANTTANTTQWVLSQSLNTTWNESTITWNNKPIINRAIGQVQGTNASNYVEWDITQAINNIGDSEFLTFQISSTALGSTTDANFASKEHPTTSYHPTIVAEYAPVEAVPLQALADSWIRSGSHASKNYGAAGYLVVRGGTSDINHSYLKFDLKGIKKPITDATLRLYNQSAITTSWQLKNVPDHDWEEGTGNFEGNQTDGITWDTAPTATALVASYTNTASQGYVDFDVTSLTTSLSTDSILSVQISSTTDLYSSFASRNNSNLALRPVLTIHTLQKKPATELDQVTILEDAFVRGGTYANENYGSSNVLTIKNDASADYAREVFFKADLSNIASNANYVTLRFYISYAGVTVSNTDWDLYSLVATSWSQNTITWNNKPAIDAYISSVKGQSSGQYIEFDITEYVRELKAQGNSNARITSLIKGFKVVGSLPNSNGDASFASLEAANPAFHPSIVSYFDEDMVPLPVEYLYFRGNRQAEGIVSLQWATIQEKNHDFFEVERSIDGYRFETIGSVEKSISQLGIQKTYFYEDREFTTTYPYSIYYRLKQVDETGDFIHSRIISVGANERFKLQFGPNPTTGVVTIHLPISPISPLNLHITNVTGVLVHQQQLSSQTTMIDLSSLPKGLYLTTIHYPDGRHETVKMIIH